MEILTDPDMLLMFEQGTQGGITQAVHRYGWANNKYMGNRFNSGKESHYLKYLDVNNLYGWAMSQNLLIAGFKWVDNPDKLKGNISKLVKEAGKGYLFEVDISYPNILHNLHNDLPFMCKRRKINGVQKLVPNLYDKKKCVIHIAALNKALKHGLVLDKVH